MENVLSIIISVITIVITVVTTSNKTQRNLYNNLGKMETQIKELSKHVELHNNFASKIPVLEEKIKHLEEKINER